MNSMTAPDAPKRRGRPPGRQKGVPQPGRRPNTPARFRHRDLKFAIKAARDAGLENYRIDVDRNGTISVVPLAPDSPAANKVETNEWDEVSKPGYKDD